MINYYKKQNTQKGAALMLFIIFFMFSSLAVSFIISRSVFGALSEYSLLERSKQAHYGSEALAEDVAYRNIAGLNVGLFESNTLFDIVSHATTTVDGVTGLWNIAVSGNDNNVYRTSELILIVGSGASFNFGLQTGNGGFHMANNSYVIGNVFSNGPISGQGSAEIKGDVISAGPAGFIDDITATGTAWAHTIQDSDIGGDAYGDTISIGSGNLIGGNVEAYSMDIGSGNTVGGDVVAHIIDDGTINGDATFFSKLNGTVVVGTETTPVVGVAPADQATSSLPVPDTLIETWKQDIIDIGTKIASTSVECSTGTYTIDFSTTIGFLRVECNLILKKTGPSTIVTLDGPLWVEGDIEFTGSGLEVIADPSIGARSIQIVADNEADRVTSSRITVTNAVNFSGSGSPKSYILLLSQNNDAEENAGAEIAIDVNNSANGDVLVYAGHGIIDIANSIALKEVTAYQVVLGQGANVTYESGLVNILFTAGPGGGFTISDWNEI